MGRRSIGYKRRADLEILLVKEIKHTLTVRDGHTKALMGYNFRRELTAGVLHVCCVHTRQWIHESAATSVFCL